MLAEELRMDQRVKVTAGPNTGRVGHVVTLPIPGKTGIIVLDEAERAFWVQETFVEPVGQEVQHEQN